MIRFLALLLLSSCTVIEKYPAEHVADMHASGAQTYCASLIFTEIEQLEFMSIEEYDKRLDHCEAVYWYIYCKSPIGRDAVDKNKCEKLKCLYKDIKL